jgi:hypothetical protein
MDHLILIKSNNKYYYHTIKTNTLQVNKLTEIVLQNNIKQLVNKNQIIYPTMSYENTTTINIKQSSNYFEKLLVIVELLNSDIELTVRFTNDNKSVSYGIGPTRLFMETAIVQFSEKYLINYNVLTDFNFDQMQKLTNDELKSIGSLLNAVLCQNRCHLPIHLPLSLLKAIKKKEFDISELEYFARIDVPEMFELVYAYRDKHIRSLC